MSYWNHYPRYVTVAEKRERAQRTLKKLRKKNPDIQPVILEGRTLAATWWGKAWNHNLERYADYANRIGRGRSYVRHLAVLDLQIAPGTVKALVQGSESKPYRVKIRIDPLSKKRWREMKTACAGKFDSLSDLLVGKFPKALDEVFTAQGKGLFPSPDEIHLNCSCPDWATMCKHVAATLYGIGARLDEDPGLFFELRKVKMEDLISEAVTETAAQLLKRATRKKAGVIDDADLGDVFGIVMEDQVDFAQKAPSLPKRVPHRGKTRKLAVPADRRTQILAVINRSQNGIDARRIQEETGIDIIKIRNTIAAAYQKGTIERVSRGVYRQTAPELTPAEEKAIVLSLINETGTGISIPVIKEKTGFPDSRVRYIVSQAFAKDEIRRVSWGRYAGKSKVRPKNTIIEAVYQAIRRSRRGLNIAQLKQLTDLKETALRNAIYRLYKRGRIHRLQRGIYTTSGDVLK